MLRSAVTRDLKQLVRLDDASASGDSRRSSADSGKHLFGLDTIALAARMIELKEPGWRGQQIAEALYRQGLAELNEFTTLPKALREMLDELGWDVGRPRIAQVFTSVDGTERYLVEAPDGLTVETVWMPEGDDGESGDGSETDEPGKQDKERLGAVSFPASVQSIPRSSAEWAGNASGPGKNWNRATICVSSQIGCAVNCQFCLTAKLGLQRNLSAGEIAGQVVAVLDRKDVEVGRDRVNLVFMGMGEPFLNYDNFMGAVTLLVREVGLSPQRMTVSTSGIVPGIERFAHEPPELRPKLAISLNAPNDQVREEIMPINRKWPIEAVMDAVRGVKLRPRERITFEYVLLSGVTDQPEHAVEVARLIRRTGLPAKVNLIAWNPGPGIAYTMPQPETVERFRATLAGEGIPAYVRRPRGRDIFAACGQLKRTVEG
jgi:23S rRNA (adenine2503-C2)-methyltransferase